MTDLSNLESEFLFLWRVMHGPKLERELRFWPPRRWRFDFAHVPTRVAIECQGGVWSRGRHARGAGMVRDYEKANAAVAAGWRVFHLSTGMITQAHLRPILGMTRGHVIGSPDFLETFRALPANPA